MLLCRRQQVHSEVQHQGQHSRLKVSFLLLLLLLLLLLSYTSATSDDEHNDLSSLLYITVVPHFMKIQP